MAVDWRFRHPQPVHPHAQDFIVLDTSFLYAVGEKRQQYHQDCERFMMRLASGGIIGLLSPTVEEELDFLVIKNMSKKKARQLGMSEGTWRSLYRTDAALRSACEAEIERLAEERRNNPMLYAPDVMVNRNRVAARRQLMSVSGALPIDAAIVE